MSIYVRWLGAFARHSTSLHESLQYELGKESAHEEAACEWIKKGERSHIHQKVGLLVPRHSIIRRFPGDVWSEYDEDGRLHTTQRPNRSHTECFLTRKNGFAGIVVKGRYVGEGYHNLPKKVKSAVAFFARKYSLPVYDLGGDTLKEVMKVEKR